MYGCKEDPKKASAEDVQHLMDDEDTEDDAAGAPEQVPNMQDVVKPQKK